MNIVTTSRVMVAIGCVMTYEILHVPGIGGQTVGADGSGLFAEIFLGDPERAAELARNKINDMEARGWKIGVVHIVQHGDLYGWGGTPVNFQVV